MNTFNQIEYQNQYNYNGNKFIDISAIQPAQDYSCSAQGGRLYYLHLGYHYERVIVLLL